MHKQASNTPQLDRVPPQDADLERALLGACLMPDNSAITIAGVLDIIRNEKVFYKVKHQHIWLAIQKLYESNVIVDYIAVINELDKQEQNK